eukprot:6476085-Amphidinium_carterae.1
MVFRHCHRQQDLSLLLERLLQGLLLSTARNFSSYRAKHYTLNSKPCHVEPSKPISGFNEVKMLSSNSLLSSSLLQTVAAVEHNLLIWTLQQGAAIGRITLLSAAASLKTRLPRRCTGKAQPPSLARLSVEQYA